MQQRFLIPALVLLLAAGSLPVLAAAVDRDLDLPKKVTFARDVAPLMQEKCGTFHRPGDIAPMSFRTFEEVRPWAKSIRRVVSEGTMPPWHADPAYGEFSNDRSLSDYEKGLSTRWVK